MTTATNTWVHDAINRLERLLSGETIDEVRLGDTGIDREWAQQSLDRYREMVKK